ncbi:hypothetical protein [Ekhidna sp. To15]|uniref:hypothetical protein n=1 Tax=Ekhidna sp. To15 TaxID=3395267 RepID=UPI003F5267BA
MNDIVIKSPLRFSITFLWIGFVCAISFMEAWLKFQAPGITIPLGLGIGRLVFGALNKVEIVLAASLIISTILDKSLRTRSFHILSISLTILLLQSFWLLPALDARAELFIQGIHPPTSYLHITYIVMEVFKVVALFMYGIKQFLSPKT